MDTRGRLTEAFDTWSAWADAQAGDDSRHAVLAEHLRAGRPFSHPAYAGHLVRPPLRAALLGLLAATLVDPEDRACDDESTTAALEDEVVAGLAAMFGPATWHGQLTSGGDIAALEALRAAREAHPEVGIAHSADGYGAHERMCELLRVPAYSVSVDTAGRMDPDALVTVLRRERVGTVVVTAGTTTLGAVDPIADILPLCHEHGVRVHVDAGYGGFFTLLADAEELRGTPAARHLRAIADCDSVLVDPHRQGLHPNPCGVLLVRAGDGDEDGEEQPGSVARRLPGVFDPDRARSGSPAAALWLTLRALPPTTDGLGEVLVTGLRGARRWRDLIDAEPELMLYQEPELDVLTFVPLTGEPHPRMSSVTAAGRHMLRADTGGAQHPAHLSTSSVRVLDFVRRHPRAVADRNEAHILRGALLRPDAAAHVERVHERVTALAAAAPRRPRPPGPPPHSQPVESAV
ncbi:aminotransferase class V-fold PLP-dependent enzyme [Embleya sp. NPDC127516]|uniref:aminotransferase class V-fold PLP-dependent enzyme n=1 Tax=Embleya sp. NPDC127516 TaxID=3363990 RepID=UPI003810C13C